MESPLITIILIAVAALVIGFIGGFLLARHQSRKNNNPVQRQLDELQARFDIYRNGVISRFNNNALLMKRLTQGYQDIQKYLNDNIDNQVVEDPRQRVAKAMREDSDVNYTPDQAQAAPKPATSVTIPPKDYVEPQDNETATPN